MSGSVVDKHFSVGRSLDISASDNTPWRSDICSRSKCTRETCVRAWYRTPTHSGCQRRSALT